MSDAAVPIPPAVHSLDAVDFAKSADGLVPAIVQDANTGLVLMLGYMDAEALARTRTEGVVTFYSRSKGRHWTKGETSGHTLTVVDVLTDCDQDAILVKAWPNGPTCHTGTASCFGDGAAASGIGPVLAALEATIAARKGAAPETSYTAKLFSKGTPKIAQKLGEEAVEVVVAALAESDDALAGETADLLYHLTVLLAARGLTLADAAKVLSIRAKT
jgi:phosphoribosyl-AMP cyclohydrolase / phosphoribosyl-ATP pyrophosphohydrolase